MKNKLLATFMLLTMVALISSCATSRKYGCPSVTTMKAKTPNT